MLDDIIPKISVEDTIRDAKDSEDIVRILIDDGRHSEEIHDIIKRNINHLKIILSKEEIQSSNSPHIVKFQEAIQLGENFIVTE